MNNMTYFDQIAETLTPAVKAYAALSGAYTMGGKVYLSFIKGDDWDHPIDLQFDSRSHVELWAQSCQRDPKLTAALFEKRMAK